MDIPLRKDSRPLFWLPLVCLGPLVRRASQTGQTEETRWTRSPSHAGKFIMSPFCSFSYSSRSVLVPVDDIGLGSIVAKVDETSVKFVVVIVTEIELLRP